MLQLVLFANVDGFVLWGLAVGGPVGFFLLSVKPQVASLVGLLWLWQAWKRERWPGLIRLAGPTITLAAVFTLLYPQWMAAAQTLRAQPEAGLANFFPWLVVPAIGLLVWAFWRNRESGAAVASTWISPYLLEHSYVGALTLITADFPWLGIVFIALQWIYFVLRQLTR